MRLRQSPKRFMKVIDLEHIALEWEAEYGI